MSEHRFSFLSNLKIPARIRFFALIVFAGLLGLLAFAYFFVFNVEGLLSNLYQGPFPASNLAAEVHSDVLSMENELYGLLLATNDRDMNWYLQDLRSLEEEALGKLGDLVGLMESNEAQLLISTALGAFSQWRPIRESITRALFLGDREEALLVKVEKSDPLILEINRIFQSLQRLSFRKAAEFEGQARDSLSTIVMVGLLLLLLMLVIVFLIYKRIVQSLSYDLAFLVVPMQEYLDSGQPLQAKVVGNNELTDISRVFNQAMDRLSQEMEIKTGLNQLSKALSQSSDFEEMSRVSANFLGKFLGALQVSIQIFRSKTQELELKGGYSSTGGLEPTSEDSKIGGIAREVIETGRTRYIELSQELNLTVKTAQLTIPIQSLICAPLSHKDRVLGLIEIHFSKGLPQVSDRFLDQALPFISAYCQSFKQKQKIEYLYQDSRETNAELEAQAEELQVLNDTLADKNLVLREQKESIHQQKNDLESLKNQLSRKANQLEDSNRYKTDFLSQMSHELRTPLNSILILSGDLAEKQGQVLGPEEARAAQVIQKSGQDLLSLINEILDLSKIESGTVVLNMEELQLEELLESLYQLFKPVAREKGLDFKLEISTKQKKLISDTQRIRQVLINLLSNAMKFTPEGLVKLMVRQSKDEKDLFFEVSDSGPGIAPENQERIFRSFEQVSGPSSASGTGLGLAIAAKLSLLLGGDLTLGSSGSLGSTFILRLPMTPSMNLSGEDTEKTGTSKVFEQSNPKVLVASSDQNFYDNFSRLLSHHNAVVIRLDHFDGESRLSGYQDIDAVLVDGHSMKAEELQDFSNSFTGYFESPLILYLWQSMENDVQYSQSANLRSVIVHSPDAWKRVLDEIGDIMEEKNAASERSSALETKRPLAHNLLKTFQGRKILLVDDDMRNLFALSKSLKEVGMEVTKAENGAVALEKMREETFDLVLMDIMMPVLDGFGAISQIRSNPAWERLPVIALTAKAMKDDKEKCLAQGFSDYLTKPVSKQTLFAAIKIWIYS